MKKIFKLFTAAALLFAASCTNTELDRYDTSVENPKEAFFKNSTIDYEYAADAAGMETYELRIYRQNCKGAAEVYLHVVSAADALGVLSAPASVTFADGEYETAVPVKVDLDQFAPGSSYSTKISLMEEEPGFKELDAVKTDIKAAKAAQTRVQAGITTYSAVTLTFSKTLEWEPVYSLKDPSKLLSYDGDTMDEEEFLHDEDGNRILGGVFTYNFWWEGDDDEVVLMHAKKTTVFRMDNWGGGVSIVFTVKPDETVEVDGVEYPRLVVTEQYIGYDYDENYGGIYIANPELVTWMYDDDAIDEFPNYYDGEYTFHFRWFYHFVGSYAYFDTQCYEEVFVLAGYDEGGDDDDDDTDAEEDPEPQVKIVYGGTTTSATGLLSSALSFTPNGDVATYYATVLKSTADDSEIEAKVLADLEENYEYWADILCQTELELDSSDDTGAYDYYYNMFVEDWLEYKDEDVEYTYLYYYLHDMIFDKHFAEYEEGFFDSIADIVAEIKAGTYKGVYPVIESTKAYSEPWALGDYEGQLVAIAYSEDASGEFSNIDYKVFTYNPKANPALVMYYLEFQGGLNYPYLGYFPSNTIDFYMEKTYDDITGVVYSVMSAEEFAAAGLTDNASNETLKAFLAANGTAFTKAELAFLNNEDDEDEGYYEQLIPTVPDTDYYLLISVSASGAEKFNMYTYHTAAADEHENMLVRALATTANGYYSHTNVVGLFQGSTNVAGGAYLAARLTFGEDGKPEVSNEKLAALITIGDNGAVTLADGAEDEDVIEFIENSGSSFSAAASTAADLYKLNYGGQVQKWLNVGAPNTPILILGTATYSDCTSSWGGAWTKTSFAPDVQFEQTVEVEGKSIKFLWEAWPEDDIFEIDAIEYALVSTSELTAAGVDLTMLGDEELNNFERRLDEGEDAGVIDAQKANAEAVESVLEAKGKVFSGDNIALKVNKGGFSGVFENNAAGQYALIAKTADAYNTKLTVAVVTVE